MPSLWPWGCRFVYSWQAPLLTVTTDWQGINPCSLTEQCSSGTPTGATGGRYSEYIPPSTSSWPCGREERADAHTHTHTNTCTPTCTSTTLGIAVQLTCQRAAGWRPWAEPPVVNPYGVISSLCCRRHLSVCHSCLLGADDLPLDEVRTRKHWTRPRTWSL